MKRNRMEHEKKIDTANHYDCLETDVREDARKNFKRQPYKSVDVAKYIAKKFGIGGEGNGQEDRLRRQQMPLRWQERRGSWRSRGR